MFMADGRVSAAAVKRTGDHRQQPHSDDRLKKGIILYYNNF